MSFTDDDLKRLKEAIGRVNVTSFGITMTPDEWKALLARLEIAEVLLERLTNPNEPYELSDIDKDHKFYLAWRKAAGK